MNPSHSVTSPYVLRNGARWDYGVVVATDRRGEQNLRVKEGSAPTLEAALEAKGMTPLKEKPWKK
jgi:hypothetical protein